MLEEIANSIHEAIEKQLELGEGERHQPSDEIRALGKELLEEIIALIAKRIRTEGLSGSDVFDLVTVVTLSMDANYYLAYSKQNRLDREQVLGFIGSQQSDIKKSVLEHLGL